MKFFEVFLSFNIILSIPELRGYDILVMDHIERIQQIFPEHEMTSNLWEDFEEMSEDDRSEKCNRLNKAQIVRRHWADSRIPELLERRPRMLTAFVNAFNNFYEMELAYGNDKIIISVLPCKFKNKDHYIAKFKDYDHYLVFWRTFDHFEDIEIAVFTSHFSLKDTGKAAIELFENIELMDYRKEIEVHRICTSIFQGLESSLVEEYEIYDIHFIRNFPEISIQCLGYLQDNSLIISYTFFTEPANYTGRSLILQNNVNEDIVINMTYPENEFVQD